MTDVRNSELSVAKHLALVLELVCVVVLIHLFRLEENRGFLTLSVVVLVGFTVHSLLPERRRLPFFLAISLLGLCLVFGVANALWMISVGVGLLALCHLPIPYAARVTLVVAAGGLLAVLRTDIWPEPWDQKIWPVLSSLFIFRLVVYLYDLRHESEGATISQRLSYFFLLPNACFPLFPIVDYTTFRRTYYNQDEYRIYQVGIRWMLRGITHLILYRLVYLYFTVSPGEVDNVGEVARFIVTNYLLYLRVSGQFHLIIGCLCLFGFNLPETHHHYYFSSSFNDFWRRINIYWKDFMMKIFFYPSFMKFRKLGFSRPLVLSTLFVFACTWLLHEYQWFWLRGASSFRLRDVVFWSILGTFVVINSLYEEKHGKKRSLEPVSFSWRQASLLSLRVVGFFVLMSVLWSFWTTADLAEWRSLWILSSGTGAVRVLGLLVLCVAVGVVGQLISGRLEGAKFDYFRSFEGSVAAAGYPLAV